MRKYVFFVILAIFLIPVICFALPGKSVIADVTGQWAESNAKYSIDADGVCTISPIDSSKKGRIPGKAFQSYSGKLTRVVIKEGIDSIGDYAFDGCKSLAGITIPNSVTSIGVSAFWSCTSLAGITIPDSVTSIGQNAFRYCTALESIVIPDSVTIIGNYVFYECSSLASVTIPDSVTTIGHNVFYECSSLKSINIPNSVTIIGQYAFYGCSALTDITIPDKITSIKFAAFQGCSSLTKITIPDNVTSIDTYAFAECTSLNSITIPDKVTSIGNAVFYKCTSLTNISLPDSVTSIGNAAFRYCRSLESITIPDGVSSIEYETFEYCKALRNITIPGSVTSIGHAAFCGCSSLTNITIPDNVTSIGHSAFCECSSLISVTVPDKVTKIEYYTFEFCNSLDSVTIKNEAAIIGCDAFFIGDLGWSLNEDGSGDLMADPKPGTTSYSVFKKNTVSFNLNGHGTDTPEPQTVEYGNKAQVPAVPTDAHFTFAGWCKDAACKMPFDLKNSPIYRSLTLYADWTPNKYTVTFNANGHGTAPAAQTVAYGGKVEKPYDLKASGYTFAGWYADTDFKTLYDFDSIVTGDVTVYAQWTKAAVPTKKAEPTKVAEPTNAYSASLKLDKTKVSLACGKSVTLKATVNGTKSAVLWKSSDTKIATVDNNGKISVKMAGQATITATAAGKSASCVVTVLYKDVTNPKDFWFAPTNYLTAKGVVKGYDKQTKFKPANKCTRAQMVTFIWRLMGEPKAKTTKCKFSDVKKTDYFYKACIWGNENHIVEGYKDGTFGPQIVCARRHAVTFLWRLAGSPNPKASKNPFKDIKAKDYFYKPVLWASEKKIVAGYSDKTFRPNGDCLRRQMVTFLYKYDKFVNGKG